MADEEAVEAGAPEEAEPAKKGPRPCQRCGNFAKRRNVLGQRLCAECAEKSLHPIAVGPLLAGDLVGATLALARALAVPAFGSALLVEVLAAGVGRLVTAIGFGPWSTYGVTFAATLLLAPVPTALMTLVGWQLLRREPLAVRAALSRAFALWTPLLATRVVTSLSVAAYSLLLVVPGLIRSADVAIAETIAAIEGRDAVGSMRESAERLRAHRGPVFGALVFLSLGLGVAIVPLLALTTVVPGTSVAFWPLVNTCLHVVGVCFAVVVYVRERLLRKA